MIIVNYTRLLNHFYFDSFLSHLIQVYIFVYIFIKLVIFILFVLSATVMFFLHCMLNILRYEQTSCEIDEWIASQHDPSSDVIFWVFIVNPFSLLCSIFFSPENCFSISLDTSGKPTVEFFLKIASSSCTILSISLDELNSSD